MTLIGNFLTVGLNQYTRRVYVGITRQSILWDIHTNKCGSCQLLGHCIVSYEICYLHPLSAVFNEGLCLPCVEVRIFPFFTSDQLSQQKHHFLAHLTTPF